MARKTVKQRVQEVVDAYYGEHCDETYTPVQIYPDPNVSNCYVVRFEGKSCAATSDNWCCVLNFDYYEEDEGLESCMLEDGIDLEPGQKITKAMFGDLKFF